MTDLSDFPITARWPAKDPDVIQLYSLATPNGIKVSIALEEMELDYEAHRIDFGNNDQKTEAFLSLNPNGKIPAIIDPNGPDGKPMALFESGAILAYLAEKSGKLMPADARGRHEVMQWLFFQIGSIGPMFGQLDFFVKFAGKDIEDPRARERYFAEANRLLGVLEQRLATRQWMMGDLYAVADIAIFPWVRSLRNFYMARGLIDFAPFPSVSRWLDDALQRPASQRGLSVPAAAKA